MDSFGDWLGRELERSPDFTSERDRLRGEATRARRATKPFSTFKDVEKMAAAVEASRERPWHERRYRWTDDRAERDKLAGVPDFDVSLRDLDAYRRRLQTRAYYFTGATANANALHALACASAPGIPISGAIASLDAPTGHGASSIAAGFNGDTRWPRASSRQAFNRYVSGVDVSEPTVYYFGPLDGSGATAD